MPAGTIDSCIGNGTRAENELIARRKRIHSPRILLHEEIGAQLLSS